MAVKMCGVHPTAYYLLPTPFPFHFNESAVRNSFVVLRLG